MDYRSTWAATRYFCAHCLALVWDRTLVGEEVLSDPLTIGSKSSSSQMALLSEEAYDTGRQRIKADVDAAAGQGAVLRFRECHDVHMAHGFKP